MKWTLASLAAVLIVAAASLGFSTGQDKPQWKYLVVKMAPGAAHDLEVSSAGNSRKLRDLMLTPMDSLGRDGWELVSVTPEPGGNYVCFFKARK